MDFQNEAVEFSVEDVDTIVKNAITGCLTDVMYSPKKVWMGEANVLSSITVCGTVLVRIVVANHLHFVHLTTLPPNATLAGR